MRFIIVETFINCMHLLYPFTKQNNSENNYNPLMNLSQYLNYSKHISSFSNIYKLFSLCITAHVPCGGLSVPPRKYCLFVNSLFSSITYHRQSVCQNTDVPFSKLYDYFTSSSLTNKQRKLMLIFFVQGNIVHKNRINGICSLFLVMMS